MKSERFRVPQLASTDEPRAQLPERRDALSPVTRLKLQQDRSRSLRGRISHGGPLRTVQHHGVHLRNAAAAAGDAARVHCVSVHPFVRMHRLKLSCWAMAANWFLRSCVDSASPSHSNMSRSRWAVVAFGIVHRAGPQADKSSSPTQSALALRGLLTSEFACARAAREAAGLRR